MHKPINYSGSWEQENKNPVLAAFILVFIWGSLYFLLSSIISSLYIGIDTAVNQPGFLTEKPDFMELIRQYYSRYKYLVLILTGIFQYVFFLILPVQMIKKWHTREITAYFQYNRFPPRSFLAAIVGIIAIIPLVDLISRFSDSLFPVFKQFSGATGVLYTFNSPLDLLLILVIISFTPAVCEEALFRGYLQRTLQRKIKFPWHFILSGFAFSLFHQQPLALPALFLVGCYLGFIYYATGSLYVSMAAHMLYNFLILLFFNLKNPPALLVDGDGYFTLWIVSGCLGIFAGCCVFIYTQHKKQQAPAMH